MNPPTTIRIVRVNGMRTAQEREAVCYVGRAFAGWLATPWGNPFSPRRHGGVDECLRLFRDHAEKQPVAWLASLWEACEHGNKPLGCWCTNATHGDGEPIVCHAQVLAAMLAERFVTLPRQT